MATTRYFLGEKIISFKKQTHFGIVREVFRVETGTDGEYEEFYALIYAKEFISNWKKIT